jgi:hypothetical protein
VLPLAPRGTEQGEVPVAGVMTAVVQWYSRSWRPSARGRGWRRAPQGSRLSALIPQQFSLNRWTVEAVTWQDSEITKQSASSSSHHTVGSWGSTLHSIKAQGACGRSVLATRSSTWLIRVGAPFKLVSMLGGSHRRSSVSSAQGSGAAACQQSGSRPFT